MAMKTVISIPNPIFQAAEQLAQELGISRSELYATAIATYIEAHRSKNVTEKLNQLYTEEASTIDPNLGQIQAASWGSDEW
jgi:metal-responsive CopG/Arc/MetJ family transcriptional regulator